MQFITSLPADTGYDHIGDTLRIKQILMNLLSNAVKFTEYGSVTLTIEIQCLSSGKDEVRLSVRDTDKGMNEAFSTHLFSPFTQENVDTPPTMAAAAWGCPLQSPMWI